MCFQTFLADQLGRTLNQLGKGILGTINVLEPFLLNARTSLANSITRC